MIEKLVIGLVGLLITWLERKCNEPKTLQDAKTPIDIRVAWNDYVASKLRDQNNRDQLPK